LEPPELVGIVGNLHARRALVLENANASGAEIPLPVAGSLVGTAKSQIRSQTMGRLGREEKT